MATVRKPASFARSMNKALIRSLCEPVGLAPSYLARRDAIPNSSARLGKPEVFGSALDITSETFRYAEPVLMAGLIVLALAVAIAQAAKKLEQRLLASSKR